jgi:hypothetical protein
METVSVLAPLLNGNISASLEAVKVAPSVEVVSSEATVEVEVVVASGAGVVVVALVVVVDALVVVVALVVAFAVGAALVTEAFALGAEEDPLDPPLPPMVTLTIPRRSALDCPPTSAYMALY